MTLSSSIASPVMDRLRQATTDAHRRAEARPLMRAIGRAAVTRQDYVTHLEQLLLIHRALEGALERAAGRQAGWRPLGLAERRRVPDLEADLRFLGGTVDPVPLPATASALAEIERSGAVALLGMFYVTEGSTNGGRFLVKTVAKALGLDLGTRDGLRSLDPYGERQPLLWADFKAAMTAIGFAETAIAELEAAAVRMFDLLGSIADAIVPAPAA